MKTILKLMAMFALVLASFGQYTTASAGNVYKYKGKAAETWFYSTDESGCIYTDVYVQANEQVYRNPPNAGSTYSAVFVTISRYDACSGLQLIYADGIAELAGPAFVVKNKAEAARLSATVEMYDYMYGMPFSVDINMTWTGTNVSATQNSTTHYKIGGCKINSHYNGAFRYAVASGSVSNGVENLTPDPAFDARIDVAKSGDVYIGCY